MSAMFASRAARRRTVTYVSLLAASLVLMAVSANPLVRDLQNGVAFAFKPFEVAIDGVATGIGSIGTAITEIDRLSIENQALKAENERLQTENRAAAEARRENDALTSLLQLRQGLDFRTLATAVIARESSEAKRAVVIDRGSNDGIAVGQVVVAAARF